MNGSPSVRFRSSSTSCSGHHQVLDVAEALPGQIDRRDDEHDRSDPDQDLERRVDDEFDRLLEAAVAVHPRELRHARTQHQVEHGAEDQELARGDDRANQRLGADELRCVGDGVEPLELKAKGAGPELEPDLPVAGDQASRRPRCRRPIRSG